MKRVADYARAVYGSRFISSGSLVLVGFFFVNVLNYAFTVIISRLLGVAEFGQVTALISLSVVAAVPGSALTLLMAREVSSYTASDESHLIPQLVSFVRKHTLIAGLMLWILALACVPFLHSALHLPNTPLIIFSFIIPLSLFASIQSGTFQGLQDFLGLSLQNIISTAIKFFGSIVLVLLGYSIAGVAASLVVGSFLALVYGFFAIRKKFVAVASSTVRSVEVFPAASAPAPSVSASAYIAAASPSDFAALLGSRMRRTFPALLLTTLLLALLSNTDVLLAKHYLSASDAGFYGALSTVGSIVVYGIGAFVTVMLPMATESHAKTGKSGQVFGLSLLVISVISLGTIAVFVLFPTLVIRLIFGYRYLSVAPYLAQYAVAMFFTALAIALTNYCIAIRNSSFLYFFVAGIAIEVLLITRYHSSIGEIVLMLIVSTAILLALLALNYGLFCRKSLAS